MKKKKKIKMKEWVLEIETRNCLKKIREPRRARDIDLGFLSIIQIMDGEGKWHWIGNTLYLSNAQVAVYEINTAILRKESIVVLDYI